MTEAEAALARFLEHCSQEVVTPSSSQLLRTPRGRCDQCGASRSLYCFDCCRLLLSADQWPASVRDGSLRLPFGVDLILDDRRSSSTGVQLKTLMDHAASKAAAADVDHQQQRTNKNNSVRLFDMELNEKIPDYASSQDERGGTFVLFPGPTSQPLSELVGNNHNEIRRLVVLDCKWSRSSVRLKPAIAALPRVHLDCVPQHSYYWRWHNAGDGMLSSAEAIYFAAWQVATSLLVRDNDDVHDPPTSSPSCWSTEDRDKLVNLMWLFGLQREIIAQRYKRDGRLVRKSACAGDDEEEPVLPFSEDYKNASRALRRLHKNRKEKTKKIGSERSLA